MLPYIKQGLILLFQEKELRMFLLSNLYKKGEGDFKWRVNLNGLIKAFNPHLIQFPLTELGDKYEGPTTFLGGGKSDYIK